MERLAATGKLTGLELIEFFLHSSIAGIEIRGVWRRNTIKLNLWYILPRRTLQTKTYARGRLTFRWLSYFHCDAHLT
jgi:hypothetical protein